jgi:hypothetical protein
MILYFSWLDITVNNSAIPVDWYKATVIPIYKEGDQSAVPDYRLVRLTSVVCKQMEHVTAGYLQQVWYRGDQNGFRLDYSCKSQIVTVCQDFAIPWTRELG